MDQFNMDFNEQTPILSIPFCADRNETDGMDTWRDRARSHMKSNGVTQDQLAERLEMTPGGVQKWLAGTRHPTLEDINRIAEILRVPPAWLTHGLDPLDTLDGLPNPARAALRRAVTAERQHQAPPALWPAIHALMDLALMDATTAEATPTASKVLKAQPIARTLDWAGQPGKTDPASQT